MSDGESLLAAIATNPEEKTVRLEYADWLEEFGKTDHDRATVEFIRVSCLTSTPRKQPHKAYMWINQNWRRLVPHAVIWFDNSRVRYWVNVDLGVWERGQVIYREDLPAHADVEWLIKRGVLKVMPHRPRSQMDLRWPQDENFWIRKGRFINVLSYGRLVGIEYQLGFVSSVACSDRSNHGARFSIMGNPLAYMV